MDRVHQRQVGQLAASRCSGLTCSDQSSLVPSIESELLQGPESEASASGGPPLKRAR